MGHDQRQGLGFNSSSNPPNQRRRGSGGGNVFALTAGFSMSGSEAEDDDEVN